MGRKMMSYEVGEQTAFIVRTTSYSRPSFVGPRMVSNHPSGPWLVFEEPVFDGPATLHERIFKTSVDGIDNGEYPRTSYVGSFIMNDVMRHVFEVIS